MDNPATHVKGLLFAVDGNISVIEIPKENSLEALQNHVGGLIELLRLPHNTDCYINEEGKLIGLPMNPVALGAFNFLGGQLFAGDFISGPMVMIGHDGEGNVADLTPDLLSAFG